MGRSGTVGGSAEAGRSCVWDNSDIVARSLARSGTVGGSVAVGSSVSVDSSVNSVPREVGGSIVVSG